MSFLNHQYLIGDQVYTEDNILVYNLNFGNFPKNATVENVTKYVSEFGEVLSVRVDNDEYLKDFPYITKTFCDKDYVVQYLNPEAAGKIFKSLPLFFDNKILKVEPCFSWDQPDGKKIIELLNNMTEANSVTSQANFCNISNEENKGHILALNDYCLEHIYKYLNNSEQINFALASPRFWDAFVLVSKAHYKMFNDITVKYLTIFQIRVLFQMVGQQIKTFTTNYDSLKLELGRKKTGYFLEFSRLFLTNIENLKVIKFYPCELRRLMENMVNLQELELHNCIIDDTFISYLKAFEKLKSLIIDNSQITGRGIMGLDGLEKLTLRKCSRISSFFLNICERLTNLTYLDIQYIRKSHFPSTTEDYKHMTKHLLQLKTLKIQCSENMFCFEVDKSCCLVQLPKLKILVINLYFCKLTGVRNFFKDLVKYQANQLEELEFVLCEGDLDVATSVAKLQKLKVLTCHDVSDECLAVFSQLHDLEEIVFRKSQTFSNKALIKLLEQRSNLKRIIFTDFHFQRHDLLSEIGDVVKRQREQGHRKNSFEILYKTRFEKMKRLIW